MSFTPHFLALAEFLERKGGALELLAYLPEAEQDPQILLSLRWAEGRFRSLVKSRYGTSLPTTPTVTPDEIKGLVADLARYHLELEHTDNASPNVITLGERTIAQLRDVAAGRAALDLPETVEADTTAPTLYICQDERPDFVEPLLRRLRSGR